MKNKTKLVLGLASLLGVTAAAGTTAGFAWFTTTRTATVSLTSANVYSDFGDLSIAYTAVDSNGITHDATKTNTLAIAATTGVTDISGDGKTFFKPVWKADNGTAQPTAATSISSISNASDKTYYVQFGVALYNSGKTSFKVYLEEGSAVVGVNVNAGSDTSLQAQQAKNDAAAKATRVAIWSTGTTPANMTTWQYDSTDSVTPSADPSDPKDMTTGFKYISSASGTAYGAVGTVSTPAKATFHAGAFTHIDLQSSAVYGQLVASVAANSSTEVIISSWIEGTLSTANNAAKGGNVSFNLNLSAIYD